MKSAQLVTFLAIASLIVGCRFQDSAVDDAGLPAKAQVDAESETVVNDSVEVISQSLSATSQVTVTSGHGLEGFVSTQNSLLPKSSAATKTTRKSVGAANTAPKAKKLSGLVLSKSGRDNPFALADQPDFEIRFLAAKASDATPLPPVPNVGLGPEPGASLLPVPASVTGPMELRPAVPTVVVPQEQPGVAPVPNSQLAVPPSSLIPTVASPVSMIPKATSPTALAEAVEIRGVVQLGDQISVIINEGEGTVSRTVQPGARLAGGQVELRRIDTTTAEPQIVLVQNGIEIVRGVGV